MRVQNVGITVPDQLVFRLRECKERRRGKGGQAGWIGEQQKVECWWVKVVNQSFREVGFWFAMAW